MSKNLIARIAVAAVAIPAILWICYQGGDWLKGMLSFFALIAALEFLYNEKVKIISLPFWLFLLTLFIMFIEVFKWQFLYFNPIYYFRVIPIILVPLLVVGMIYSIGKESPSTLFSKYTRIFWGLFYIGFLYPNVYQVSQIVGDSFSGGDSLLLLFGILWVGDTAAMFGGKAFGKRKLAPTVSPNKTVEGFISGIIGAIIVSLIMYFWKFNEIQFYHMIFVAIGCSIFGQLGDLVESMWKRSLNIKDSSAIIPGHGGILDRFDSLLFAAPFMVYYMMFVV